MTHDLKRIFMANIVIIGMQWGDEGKGKVVDLLTEYADVVVRFQGGNNAGHTVVVGQETIILHLIPSGALYRDKVCVIGNGVVVDPQVLLQEIDELRKRGHFLEDRQLLVSEDAHLIMPYHRRHRHGPGAHEGRGQDRDHRAGDRARI